MMKKGIALLLTLTLAAGATVPAYAQETAQSSDQKQTVEVTLDSIEDIMSTYNLNVKTYLNNLKIAKDNKDDYEDTDNEEYYDNQYDAAQVQYDENMKNAVLNAKQSYLNYCADNDRYAAAQTSAENAQKAYNAALSSLSSGFISQSDCDSQKDKYNQAQNTLTQLDSQLIRERASLRTLLNLPSNVNMDIKPVTADDLTLQEIPKINYSADVIVMRGLNSNIKKAKLAYELQQNQEGDPGYTKNTLDNAYIALQQTRTSEEAAFQKLYDSMTSAYTVYQQALDQVQRKQAELTQESKALSLGYSSQKSVDEKTDELKTLQSTLADDRNTLFTSYLSYINMKNGFSTGS
ncbi:TolC family protein [Caproicibacter fermentans]|uniref:TolC family protein n=1 Tax=Caproicibacter fermentans TaxID=2576756 RepID=A0A7G8T967_9FIRM|nr:TolC family protein [Caproicibacter fermentans]QNK40158.1 TolC family protein [Caproicibacter fermentans]